MFENLKTIVVGVDLLEGGSLSAGSAVALDAAKTLASMFGTRIVVFHATKQRDESLRERLESAAGVGAEDGASAAVVHVSKKPADALIEHVVESGCGMIVVGDHDQPARLMPRLGSMTRGLLRHSPVPVYVAHHSYTGRPSRILAMTDLKPEGQRAVATAAALAAQLGAELTVGHAHAMTMEDQLASARMTPEEIIERIQEFKERGAAKIREALPPTSDAKLVVEVTGAVELVERLIEEIEPELLVLGTTAVHGLAGRIFGSVASQIVDRVPSSVLVLRPLREKT
jgi:nucleotide-binding universal stress UspA family protein